MGSLCGSSQTTQQQSSSTPTGLPQLNSIWNQVQQVANQPYTPYSGQLVAGLTPEQQTGISNVNAAYGTAQPYFNQAAQYATAGAQPISAAAIQGYQSPYTQQVVDATQAQFNNQNAQQQNSLKGNLAMSNALGGDRQAVAQSVLAGQQKLAQAPTIAGLYNQSYGQALSAAQADRAAQGQAAYTFGALAPSVQNANLQGAQAQLGAGQLEQSTNQAGLSAAYNQYLQQLAFPYQQAGFLASAGLPAVTAMGGSQAGSTTSPGPNPWAQVAGLGIAGASLLSDARVKTDKRQVGKTFDGQPIYTFRYEGSPYTQMGLMAQEVEKKHPEAVGEAGGLKTVDYEAATPIKKAGGGPVGLFDVQTYVPRFGGVSAAPVNYGHAPNAPSQAAMPSFSPQSIVSAGKGLQGLFGSDDPTPQTGYTGVSGEAFPGMADATIGYQGGVSYPIFGEARGGRVGYAEGGGVDFDAAFSPFAVPPDNTPNNRALALALADKYQPQDDIALNAGAPLPRPRPFEAPGVPVGSIPDDGGLPTTAISPTAGRIAMPASPLTPPVQPSGDLSDDGIASDLSAKAGQPLTSLSQFQPKSNPIGGWNPFNLSDDARLGIAAAGLGMAAARTPFALSAAGEGGLAGLKTYEQQKQQRQSAELAARKLMQSADQFGQNLGLHKDQLAETKRQHDLMADRENSKFIGVNDEGFPVYLDSRSGTETVGKVKLQGKATPGYVRGTDANGNPTMTPIKGGPADPEQASALAKAKATGGVLPDDTADWLAERVIAGDAKALTNLGRGAQGAENIIKVQSLAARKAAERGLNPNDLLAKVAEQSGLTAQQRTFGTQVARMAVNATEAQGAIDLGRKASDAVPRTNWVPVNRAIQAYQTGTSDPKLAQFGAANLAIVNTYSRAISPTGTPTVHDKEHAERLLSTATGPEAYNAVLDQLNKEIEIAHAAPLKAKAEMEAIRKAGAGAAPPHAGAGTTPPAAPPAKAVEYLRAHPEASSDFDAKYGAGAARGILGQ